MKNYLYSNLLGVIMMSWLMYMKLFNVKEKLKNTRKVHLENFHNRTKVCLCSLLESLIHDFVI